MKQLDRHRLCPLWRKRIDFYARGERPVSPRSGSRIPLIPDGQPKANSKENGPKPLSSLNSQGVFFALEPVVGFGLVRWPGFNWNGRPFSVEYALCVGFKLLHRIQVAAIAAEHHLLDAAHVFRRIAVIRWDLQPVIWM